MTPDYLLGIFHWRDYAGDLDGPQSRASLKMLLWGCERWLELNPTATDTDDGRRLIMIKLEIEDWLERNETSQPTEMAPPLEFLRLEEQ
jgi:hypothetical protein